MKKNIGLLFAIVLMVLIGCTSKTDESSQKGNGSEPGIIYAKPEDLVVNTPYNRVLEIGEFFIKPENRVKIQFPIQESHYAWQNMSKFYPTSQILRSKAINNLSYKIDPSIGETSFTDKNGTIQTVNSHFDNYPIDALIVVKSGEIIYERYKTMRPIDKHIWFSVSKVTGATMLAFLEMEGKVDVNLPVSHYLNELKGSEWDSVKVVEALDMATGLNGTEHDEPNHDSRTNPKQIWYQWATTVGIVADEENLNQKWYDVLKKMKRVRPAYEIFEYNSINTFVVNRITERVAGKPLNEQFSERIWSKAGMEHDGFYLMSPSGLTLGFLGVNSSLRDLARFGLVFTPSCKKVNGQEIIPKSIMDKIHDRSHIDMYGKGWAGQKFNTSFSDDKEIANRYQWDAVLSDGDMFKSGVGGQGVYISPEDDMVVAWFCTSDGNNQEETMARAIVKSLSAK